MSNNPRKKRKRAEHSQVDQREFEQFFREHFRFVKSRSMMSCHNEETAEHLALDTFARAARAFHRFDHRYPQAWLKMILRNVVIDFYNKQKREREVFVTTEFDLIEKTHQEEDSVQMSVSDYELLESAIMPSDSKDQRKEHAQTISEWCQKYLSGELKAGLESLSDSHRNILIAREVLGYNYTDISKLFDIKEGTVMSRLSRARVSLQRYLSEIASCGSEAV